MNGSVRRNFDETNEFLLILSASLLHGTLNQGPGLTRRFRGKLCLGTASLTNNKYKHISNAPFNRRELGGVAKMSRASVAHFGRSGDSGPGQVKEVTLKLILVAS